MGVLARRQCRSTSTIYRRCREAVLRLVMQPELSGLTPDAELVLIADGFRFRIGGTQLVQYTMAFKPTTAAAAFFADPVLLSGGESATNWQQVLSDLEPPVRSRIRALVTDGLRGMKELAASYGWVYQRCHFHIRAQLRPWLSGGRTSLPDDVALRRALDDALLSVDEEQAEAARAVLAGYVQGHSGAISAIVGQLVRDWDAVRAYRRYPSLGIPRTTNVVESVHSSLRDIVSGVNSIDALVLRTAAFIRLHSPFGCADGNSQQH